MEQKKGRRGGKEWLDRIIKGERKIETEIKGWFCLPLMLVIV
jgi:hypothetical protein